MTISNYMQIAIHFVIFPCHICIRNTGKPLPSIRFYSAISKMREKYVQRETSCTTNTPERAKFVHSAAEFR